MSNKKGSSISSLDGKIKFSNLKVKWNQLLGASVGAFSVATGADAFNISNSAGTLRHIFNAFGAFSFEPTVAGEAGELLFLAWIKSFQLAVRENNLSHQASLLNEDWETGFRDEVQSMDDFEVSMDDLWGNAFLQNTQFFQVLTDQLALNLKKWKVEDSLIEDVKKSLGDRLSECFWNIWLSNPDNFKLFRNFYIENLATQSTRNENSKAETYRKKLEDFFTDKSDNAEFGPRTKGASLKQVYVDPRCRKIEIQHSEQAIETNETGKSLTEEVKGVLKSRFPIVVQGEPGHGKTSFAVYLAHQLSKDTTENWFPVLCRFKDFIPPKDALLIKTKSYEFGTEDFFRKTNTVFILDGTDEIYGAQNINDIRNALERILEFCSDSQEEKFKANVVITTREKFFESSADEISDLLKYRHLFSINDFGPEELEKWFEKYKNIPGKERLSQEKIEKYLQPDKDRSLIGQPILLTFVAEMLTDSDESEKKNKTSKKTPTTPTPTSKKIASTRFDIYEQILNWTFIREEKKFREKKTDKQATFDFPFQTSEEFSKFLEGIAVTLSRSDEKLGFRVGKIRELWSSYIKLKELCGDKWELWNQKDLNFMLFFYIKGNPASEENENRQYDTEYEVKESWVEFIHKSFWEFFIAKAILRFLKKVEKETNLELWILEIIGWKQIDPNSLNFLDDAIKIWKPKLENLKDIRSKLVTAFKNMQERCYFGEEIIENKAGKPVLLEKEADCFAHGLANLLRVISVINDQMVSIEKNFPKMKAEELFPKPEQLYQLYSHLEAVRPGYFSSCEFDFKTVDFSGMVPDIVPSKDKNTLPSAVSWIFLQCEYPQLAKQIQENRWTVDIMRNWINKFKTGDSKEEVWKIPDDQILKIPESLRDYIAQKEVVTLVSALPGYWGSDELFHYAKVNGPKTSKKEETKLYNPDSMVTITKSAFLYGDEKKDKSIDEDFKIDMYPVTNERYKRFISAGGYDNKKAWSKDGWKWKEKEKIRQPAYWDVPRWNQSDHPVVGVSWYEADAFARWEGKRLPTEEEWERAARGTDGRKYPWGEEFDKEKCNSSESEIAKTTPVTRYPNGISQEGCYDMAGNVWEWTGSWYDKDKKYKILRGGSWYNYSENVHCSYRSDDFPSLRNFSLGFRCAQ
jgi:formylglycine-generating enzyme required for sulfatase activity